MMFKREGFSPATWVNQREHLPNVGSGCAAALLLLRRNATAEILIAAQREMMPWKERRRSSQIPKIPRCHAAEAHSKVRDGKKSATSKCMSTQSDKTPPSKLFLVTA